MEGVELGVRRGVPSKTMNGQRYGSRRYPRYRIRGTREVEHTQLRTASRVIKWAILAVVTAARIERLRVLARTNPEDSALTAFNEHEIQGLILMKRRHKKRTELVPDTTPTLAQAVRWLADLGGYAGHKSSGRPGAVTLRRGLDYIAPVAIAIETLKSQGKL